MTFAGPKGQGATEYLVLLAVVLIIAMVVVALLGFFPGMSYDTKKSESDTYWRSMSPLQVVSSSHQAPNGNLSIVFLNVASDQLQITNLSLSGGGCNGATTAPTYISSGEQKTVTSNFTDCACASGVVYEYQMNITYIRTGLTQTEFGAKTLLGKCA